MASKEDQLVQNIQALTSENGHMKELLNIQLPVFMKKLQSYHTSVSSLKNICTDYKDLIAVLENLVGSLGSDLQKQNLVGSLGSDLEKQNLVGSLGSDLQKQNLVGNLGSDLEKQNLVGSLGSHLQKNNDEMIKVGDLYANQITENYTISKSNREQEKLIKELKDQIDKLNNNSRMLATNESDKDNQITALRHQIAVSDNNYALLQQDYEKYKEQTIQFAQLIRHEETLCNKGFQIKCEEIESLQTQNVSSELVGRVEDVRKNEEIIVGQDEQLKSLTTSKFTLEIKCKNYETELQGLTAFKDKTVSEFQTLTDKKDKEIENLETKLGTALQAVMTRAANLDEKDKLIKEMEAKFAESAENNALLKTKCEQYKSHLLKLQKSIQPYTANKCIGCEWEIVREANNINSNEPDTVEKVPGGDDEFSQNNDTSKTTTSNKTQQDINSQQPLQLSIDEQLSTILLKLKNEKLYYSKRLDAANAEITKLSLTIKTLTENHDPTSTTSTSEDTYREDLEKSVGSMSEQMKDLLDENTFENTSGHHSQDVEEEKGENGVTATEMPPKLSTHAAKEDLCANCPEPNVTTQMTNGNGDSDIASSSMSYNITGQDFVDQLMHENNKISEESQSTTTGEGSNDSNIIHPTPNTQMVQKPCVCDVCGKTFKYPSGLSEHKQIHLPGIFKCTMCERHPFTNKSNWNKHMRQVHKQPLEKKKPLKRLKKTNMSTMQKKKTT